MLQMGATLRHNITLPVPTPPALHLALVIGASSTTNTTVSTWLAQDTKTCLIDVGQYFLDISTMSFIDQRELLIPLHPSTLHEYLRSGDAVGNMDAFFLTKILRRKLDAEVSRGARSFLLVGLNDNFEAAKHFANKVAQPSAIIWLRDSSNGVEVREMKMARHFSCVPIVKVSVGTDDEVNYRQLLAVIGQKIVVAGTTRDGALYDRRDSVESSGYEVC